MSTTKIKFLQTSPSLCGSSIFIVAKRYPNDAPHLEGLISELRNNHIFVYIVAHSSPSGGTNPSAMFEVSSKTNGFCIFGPIFFKDSSSEIYISSIAFIQHPYQVASKNVRVTGSGSQSLSVKTYSRPIPYTTEQLIMFITFLGHPRDGSVKSLNYAMTDPNGKVIASGPFQPVLQRNDTLCYEIPVVVNNIIEYTLTVNYEYEKDREGYLELRFYSYDYKIGYWLPFDN
ncbi:hypothetical protein CAEBREN_15634 [Caenorhabditis brenneri]|uniref:DUF7154 domain-containing protein n=1 Tax=Caenorhabditis brenneri TaxID=135651 RepID=G0PB12_CAEBE|nr:hypothetical protein CAEBREN_15634 [Caenorhabditis brenneri]